MKVQIQESQFVDIFRIENGTLLYVNKHTRHPLHKNTGSFYGTKFKKASRIVRGCKGLTQLKTDFSYQDWKTNHDSVIPAGTFLLDGYPIVEANPEDYFFELKSNEGIKGKREQIKESLKIANEIIDSYKSTNEKS